VGAVRTPLTVVTGSGCILSTTMPEVVLPGLLGELGSRLSSVNSLQTGCSGVKRWGKERRINHSQILMQLLAGLEAIS
jgi:hypothetical protein